MEVRDEQQCRKLFAVLYRAAEGLEAEGRSGEQICRRQFTEERDLSRAHCRGSRERQMILRHQDM